MCLSATAGAVVGDGLSYWLGQRYRERLRTGRDQRPDPTEVVEVSVGQPDSLQLPAADDHLDVFPSSKSSLKIDGPGVGVGVGGTGVGVAMVGVGEGVSVTRVTALTTVARIVGVGEGEGLVAVGTGVSVSVGMGVSVGTGVGVWVGPPLSSQPLVRRQSPRSSHRPALWHNPRWLQSTRFQRITSR